MLRCVYYYFFTSLYSKIYGSTFSEIDNTQFSTIAVLEVNTAELENLKELYEGEKNKLSDAKDQIKELETRLDQLRDEVKTEKDEKNITKMVSGHFLCLLRFFGSRCPLVIKILFGF